ncbi:MAG TPA: C39 family peptidase [Candidatus Tyrphobacter sp.]|nr:C39 family peptidase [Candidatus Tyrphobacter sp.]
MSINILKVKPFQETLNADMCGPASLKMVLAYWGLQKSESELARLLGVKKGLGTDDKSLKLAAEKHGFKVKIKNNASFADLERWLGKGVPVMVDWFSRGRLDYPLSAVPDGHYSVVVGLDKTHIYLQDPEIGGLRKITRDDFGRVWFDFRGKTIKPGELVIRQMIAIYKK